MLLTIVCILLLRTTRAATIQGHQSGGAEHIVIIDRTHPAPPLVAEVLERLTLNESHPDVRHVFNNSAFTGFAASMRSHCLDLLANMTDISVVEQTVNVRHTGVIKRQASLVYDTRPNAPWGLQSISTGATVRGSADAMDYTYSFASSSLGKGVDIYILDTGVYTAHNVFDGRATMAWSYDGDMNDLDGHGTHVRSTTRGSHVSLVVASANLPTCCFRSQVVRPAAS